MYQSLLQISIDGKKGLDEIDDLIVKGIRRNINGKYNVTNNVKINAERIKPEFETVCNRIKVI